MGRKMRNALLLDEVVNLDDSEHPECDALVIPIYGDVPSGVYLSIDPYLFGATAERWNFSIVLTREHVEAMLRLLTQEEKRRDKEFTSPLFPDPSVRDIITKT